tara:strand:- start:837 stop:1610 length:774 start_codon:yes stop_codon:yes gene_type:complete
MNSPIVSIITIVLNRKEDLEKTLESITNQSFKDKELIIIDGGSTDGSLEVLDKYSENINILVSEKDKGIYDAMNKGVKLARGEWLSFMNAGDTYFNDKSLNDVFKKHYTDDYDLLIGDTVISYKNFKKELKVKALNKIWKGARFIHQSVLIKRIFQLKNLYNIDNKISADFEFFYQTINAGSKIKILNQNVSIFQSGGISDTSRIRSSASNMKVVLKNEWSFYKLIFYIFKIIYETIKIPLKFILPKKVISFIQQSK